MRRHTVGASVCCIVVLCACIERRVTPTPEVGERSPAVSANFLPVSVWYSGGTARAPMLSEITESSETQWRADLERIRDLGFNTVRTWVEWAHSEPEKGVYRLDNLRLLARLADEVGLRFMIQLYVDSAPDWVGREFPDGLYEAQDGTRIRPQSAPGLCTDHPGVRDAVLGFITETARVAASYPNFVGWDLWSEPHIVNWAYINYVPDVQFCYCPHTTTRFRAWLRDKYGTLEALNAAWYRGFEQWEELDPPRFGTILSYTDFLDWKFFLYDKLADDLGMRAGAVRQADPDHVVTSHAAIPSVFYSPYNGYGATDDFLMAEQVDYYGTSLYPKHNHPDRHWQSWMLMVAIDFSASANRRNGGFFVGELQAGPGTYGLNVGNPITPQDHRMWMWSSIAKGARAINVYAYYPMSSGYESGGYGLVNLDGSPTERAVEAGRTARIIGDNSELLLTSRSAPAQAALVYNPLAQMVGGEQRHGPGSMLQESLFGYYRMFAENNVPVEFIHRRDLESGSLGGFRLIVVPYPLMLSERAARGIERFVRDGGFVVAEARLAWNDERGFASAAIPGMGLDAVFGARETAVRMREQVELTTTGVDHPLLEGLPPGSRLAGAYFEEALVPLSEGDPVVLAETDHGAPVLIAARHGAGETVLIGSFLGMADHAVPSAVNRRFALNMIDWAGIERPIRSSHDFPVELRLRETDHIKLLFCINHGRSAEDVWVDLPVDGDATYRVRSLLDGRIVDAAAAGPTLRVHVPVPASDVEVLAVERDLP